MSDSGFLPLPKSFATTAVHSGHEPGQWDSLCLVPPIVHSTTFKQYGPGVIKKFVHGRLGNPTREVLEMSLAAIEDAEYGVCLSCGMGAMTVMMGLLSKGDHIVSGDEMYGGSFRLLDQMSKKFGIELTVVDATNVVNVKNAMKINTKLIFIETPTNPLLKVADIAALADVAKKHDAILAVDNTFLTSYFQRPLALGAGLSIYSLTKYVNGHSDVMMGAIVTNNKELAEKLHVLQNDMGIVPSPFDCSMVIRSLKTLPLRMKQHSSNALAVAKFLEAHPKVLKVIHPGLPSHPQHELSKKQTSGHSGMVPVYLRGGFKEAEKFVKTLKLFSLAGSLGGDRSQSAIPSLMTHTSMTAEQRELLKISDNLVRLSVGLEEPEDLIDDLTQALETI